MYWLLDAGKFVRVVVCIHLIQACYNGFQSRGAMAVESGDFVADVGMAEGLGLLEEGTGKRTAEGLVGNQDQAVEIVLASFFGVVERRQ